jgi:Secretion system C-terminal sorting domain
MSNIRIFYFVITFLISSLTYSQITITQSDYTNLFNIGYTLTSSSIVESQTIDIGQLGENNQWNFVGLTADEMLEINYISPAGTPFENTFSDANIVGYLQFSDDEGGTVSSGESWNYYFTNDATILGTGIISSFTSEGQEFTSSGTSIHFPPFNQYNFPINFGDMWTKKDSSETNTTSDQGNFTSSQVTEYEIHVDAWGTMVMPSGKVVSALRFREVAMRTSYFSGFPTGTTTSVDYSFMGENGESFSISPDNENVATSGEITGSVNWSNDNVTGIEKLETLPTEFSLKQNYPNPFNPSTKIEYSITEPSFVRLNVYDILGNEVAVLVNENQTAGSFRYNFDGSDLASGAYIVRLGAGEKIETMKITLMK